MSYYMKKNTIKGFPALTGKTPAFPLPITHFREIPEWLPVVCKCIVSLAGFNSRTSWDVFFPQLLFLPLFHWKFRLDFNDTISLAIAAADPVSNIHFFSPLFRIQTKLLSASDICAKRFIDCVSVLIVESVTRWSRWTFSFKQCTQIRGVKGSNNIGVDQT